MTELYDPKRLVTLTNGALVPFEEACVWIGNLATYFENHDQEWDVVHLLRQVCLGNRLAPEQTRALVCERLLQPDGTVEPVLEAVVLAAVRGEGRTLRLDSPFTNPLDRAMAEFFNAREYVRNCLEPAEAAAFFAHDPVQQSFERFRKATDPTQKWIDREAKRRESPPDELPPQ